MNEPFPNRPHTGAILVGGLGSQACTPKEGAGTWDSLTMLEQVLSTMLCVCRTVAVVGANFEIPSAQQESVRLIHNPDPDLSPLSGLAALLGSNLDSGYLIAACNQPFLTIPLLRQLIEGNPSRPHLFLVPKGISFHPFPGYYPAALLETVEQIQSTTQASLRDVFHEHPPQWVPLSESEEKHLLSVNPPAQLEKLQHLAGHN